MWANKKCALTPAQLEILNRIVKYSILGPKERYEKQRRVTSIIRSKRVNELKALLESELEEPKITGDRTRV